MAAIPGQIFIAATGIFSNTRSVEFTTGRNRRPHRINMEEEFGVRCFTMKKDLSVVEVSVHLANAANQTTTPGHYGPVFMNRIFHQAAPNVGPNDGDLSFYRGLFLLSFGSVEVAPDGTYKYIQGRFNVVVDFTNRSAPFVIL